VRWVAATEGVRAAWECLAAGRSHNSDAHSWRQVARHQSMAQPGWQERMRCRSFPCEYRSRAEGKATIKPRKSDELPESAIGYAVNLSDFDDRNESRLTKSCGRNVRGRLSSCKDPGRVAAMGRTPQCSRFLMRSDIPRGWHPACT
jgi:hypothetical protein